MKHSVILVVMLVLVIFALAGCSGEKETDPKSFTYVVENGNAIITGYTGEETKIVIPPKIDGYPVIRIGARAFKDNRHIDNIIIPNGVTSIGESAFEHCSLTTITIPNSVTSIEGKRSMIHTRF